MTDDKRSPFAETGTANPGSAPSVMRHPLTFDPDYVVPTAEVLREWLDHNHLTTRIAAARCYRKGEPRDWAESVLNAVLADEPLDEAACHVLYAVTAISVAFWRSFERNYRAGLAAGKYVAGAWRAQTRETP